MTDRAKGYLSIVIFVITFIIIWSIIKIGVGLNLHDLMALLILEIPLQLAIHYLTGKKC